jgi:hypothetical protein
MLTASCPDQNDTQGFKPGRSLEVMMFTSEEPTRFGLSCIGSRAMAGTCVCVRACVRVFALVCVC